MKTILNNKERAFHVYVADTYIELVGFKKSGEVSSFNDLLLKLMPEVKKYVENSLNTAVAKGKLDKNRFKSDDIIDQLFIEVYDHFEEVDLAEFLYLWLFKKADELLDDMLTEEEFDSYFYENIDKFTKPEWDEMEEKFSTDGDGDLQMLEEFDGQEYPKNDYVLNHVFIENKDTEILESLDEKLEAKNIKKHTNLVLYNLPESIRKVYELSNVYKFNVNEIAKISKLSESEVVDSLAILTKNMKISFINRYIKNI